MDQSIQQFASKYLEALRSPLSVGIAMMLASGDGEALSTKRVDPRNYNDREQFARDYCAVELLRKFPGLPGIKIDRTLAARESFYASEHDCFRTNLRLTSILDGCSPFSDSLHDFIQGVRKNVQRWIGNGPGYYQKHGNFGPGATYGNKGKRLLVADKLQDKPQITRSAWAEHDVSNDYIFGWGKIGGDPLVVKGNRFTTVPKDARKDRGICIEPSVNLFYQKGLGTILRSRLKKVGFDLNEGQPRNGRLAYLGSNSGELCTIDLSSASDTVAWALVKLLLPRRWFECLEALRSPYTLIDGRWIKLEKFSSMGNGYTFELETLIFAAIAVEVMWRSGEAPLVGRNVLCYGDDIIVPTKVCQTLLSALKFFGFKPNERKTYSDTYFRESCGHDYFQGLRIEPLRLDDEISVESCFDFNNTQIPLLADGVVDFRFWIIQANRMRQTFTGLGMWGEPKVLSAWRYCISQIPLRNRLFGPKRLGDAVIHDLESSWTIRRGEMFHGVRCIPGTRWVRAHKAITQPVPWNHWRESVMLATRIFTPSDHSKGHTGRGCAVRAEIGWVSVS